MPTTERKPWLAASASLLCPGLGQFYCGRFVRGVVLFVLSLLYAPVTAVAAIAEPSDGVLHALIGAYVASALVSVIAVLDAWMLARQRRMEFTIHRYQRPALYAVFLVAGVVINAGLLTAVRTCSFAAYKLPTGSMSPTLQPGDHVLANKLRFGRVPVERGDIVVFRAPDRELNYVKRVIGLPGDSVKLTNGRVLLNGQLLPVDAPASGTDDGVVVEHLGERTYRVRLHAAAGGTANTAETTVPPASYFVLGDGRDTSMDSSTFGPVSHDNLIGRVEYVLVPGGDWSRAGALSEAK
ncbi:MAG: signal peptidase I [Planctomycetes bacterium]|nr:signal peptidase I [Planctomycetota bacterium]